MSEPHPHESAGLDAYVQRQVADAERRKRDREDADAALRAGTLASDADRDITANVLNEAYAQGRLTSEEHAERTTRAFTARTHGDLDEVLTGLLVPTAPEDNRAARKVLFWMVTVITSPFLLMGLGLLIAGQDLGDRVFGIVFLVLFGPGLFALQRWAWPPSGPGRWSRVR